MSRPPESESGENAGEEAGQAPAPPGPEKKPKGIGDLALAWAVGSWAATFILLFILLGFISGYRAEGGVKMLGLLVVLAPALASIVIGGDAIARGQAAHDRGAVAYGGIAITSGVILLPLALIAFWFMIVRV